jgi:hypothetical protein
MTSKNQFVEWEVRVLKQVAAAQVASPSELRGKFADRTVKKDPPRWEGESYVGRKWSECPPEYLEDLAGFNEWKVAKDRALPEAEQAKNDKGVPWWTYNEKDARLQRAWAIRNRELQGGRPAPGAKLPDRVGPTQAEDDASEPGNNDDGDSDIPF